MPHNKKHEVKYMRNQILSVENTQNAKKKMSVEQLDIKKIITFFAIVIIVFSICAIGIGVYNFIENNGIIGYKKSQIEAEKVDDKLLITVTSTIPIERIEYEWNGDGNKKVMYENNNMEITEKINLPSGNNSLKIEVYNVNGKVQVYENSFEVESYAPQLSIEAVNGKIKVIAKDNEKMQYITYRWDEEPETKVNATAESSAQIEQEIEIPQGKHTLTIVAVNSRNLTTEKTQEVKGVKKPAISAIQDAENMENVIVTVKDDEGIKNIIFDLNGKKYQIDLSSYHETTFEYSIKLEPGNNRIEITVTNFDGAEGTFIGECSYNP